MAHTLLLPIPCRKNINLFEGGYLSFIVAMPTIKDFIAAWGSNAAPPSIVCTPDDDHR
jgi:membrane-bound metal-dependent hydrolase YbcI (DUF457 family)